MKKDFFNKLRILDGGMGQELHFRGLISKGTLWSTSAVLDKKYHDLIVDIHLDYIKAGAEVITTTNFSSRRIRMVQNRVNNFFEFANQKSCELALKAKEKSKKEILIAGSIPAQFDSYKEDTRAKIYSKLPADLNKACAAHHLVAHLIAPILVQQHWHRYEAPTIAIVWP